MANFVYTIAASKLLSADIDLNADDIRVMLVMANTTADTERDATTISGFTTLDECDGASYARKTLTGEAVNTDNTNDRGEFDANDIQWASLGAGTRNNQAMVVYKHVTNDADSIPICYIDTTSPSIFPFNGNGGNVDIAWNAEGILQGTTT